MKKWRCGVSNPGPLACKASALPLSYTPAHIYSANKNSIYSFSLPDYTAQLNLITLCGIFFNKCAVSSPRKLFYVLNYKFARSLCNLKPVMRVFVRSFP